jgi:hypothetical protein
VARLDPFDHAFVPRCRPHPDAVAGGDDVALFRNQRSQQAADGAAELPAVLDLHHALLAVHAQHPAGQALAGIHSRHLGRFLA